MNDTGGQVESPFVDMSMKENDGNKMVLLAVILSLIHLSNGVVTEGKFWSIFSKYVEQAGFSTLNTTRTSDT